LVVVNRPVLFQAPAVSTTIATSEIMSSAEEVTMEVTESPAAEARTVLHPAFPGVTKEDTPATEAVATANHVPLDWMNQVRLESVSAENTESLWFDTRPAIQAH